MAVHRLLVVDDDPSTRDALRNAYTRMGWKVIVAGTVAEALALLDTEPEPCCLILDLLLPDGDGLAVFENVRAKALKTGVVVCTRTVNLARLKAAAELKPDAMLPKPIRLPDVWTEPCRVCRGSERDGSRDAAV